MYPTENESPTGAESERSKMAIINCWHCQNSKTCPCLVCAPDTKYGPCAACADHVYRAKLHARIDEAGIDIRDSKYWEFRVYEAPARNRRVLKEL